MYVCTVHVCIYLCMYQFVHTCMLCMFIHVYTVLSTTHTYTASYETHAYVYTYTNPNTYTHTYTHIHTHTHTHCDTGNSTGQASHQQQERRLHFLTSAKRTRRNSFWILPPQIRHREPETFSSGQRFETNAPLYIQKEIFGEGFLNLCVFVVSLRVLNTWFVFT